MGVAVEQVVAKDRLEDEAEEHYAGAVAELLRLRLQPLEVVAACARGREHASTRPLRHDAGHAHEWMPREETREGRLVLGLAAIVELLGDPGLQLRGERLRIEPRIQHAEHRIEPRQVRHVRADRVVDARVLHLDDDLLAVGQARRVHLADARRRDRLGLEVGEERRERLPEVGLYDLASEIEGHRRRRGLELLQRGPILLRHVVGDEAHDLRELHHGAFHVADDGEHVLGVAQMGRVGERLPPLGPRDLRSNARPELPRRELRREKPNACRPTELRANDRRAPKRTPGPDTFPNQSHSFCT
jgi:hypothetical protein